MAFKKENLVALTSEMTSGYKEFKYYVPSGDTITTKNYFPKSELAQGDKVIAVVVTKHTDGYVTGRSETAYFIAGDGNGDLTATALMLAGANIPVDGSTITINSDGEIATA